jgi:hypothetical protein
MSFAHILQEWDNVLDVCLTSDTGFKAVIYNCSAVVWKNYYNLFVISV